MADRSLRGIGISFTSMETEDGVEFADRVETAYDCQAGHTVIVPFAAAAEIPAHWQCRCGIQAVLRDAEDSPHTQARRHRSHWDMLLERRTIPELEALLQERLELLRGGRARMTA
jgi:hypothetical protein